MTARRASQQRQANTEGGEARGRGAIWFWVGVTAAGLVLRIAVLPLGPRYGYLMDHATFVRWGVEATDRGVMRIYDESPPTCSCASGTTAGG